MGKSRCKTGQQSLVQVRSWKEADKYVRRIGDNEAQIQRLIAEAKADIDKRKAKLAGDVQSLQNIINLHTRSLEAFALAHKPEFDGKRSRKLNFGVIGWRLSKSIGITKATTLDRIRERLTAAKAKMCIIVKETVSKDGLAKLTDEQLACVGARRKVKDDFFVEPDMPEAADYSEGK